MGGIKLQLFDCFAVDSETAIAFLIIGCIIFLLSLIPIATNPFCYPYFYYTFDVTGKRNINIEDDDKRIVFENNTLQKLIITNLQISFHIITTSFINNQNIK